MPATPQYLSVAMSLFPARYPGTCQGCNDSDIVPGDLIAFSGFKVIKASCCIDYSPIMGEAIVDDEGLDSFNIGRSPHIPVMPRGKTKRDMCQKCFQIPSNSGVCGCDS